MLRLDLLLRENRLLGDPPPCTLMSLMNQACACETQCSLCVIISWLALLKSRPAGKSKKAINSLLVFNQAMVIWSDCSNGHITTFWSLHKHHFLTDGLQEGKHCFFMWPLWTEGVLFFVLFCFQSHFQISVHFFYLLFIHLSVYSRIAKTFNYQPELPCSHAS